MYEQKPNDPLFVDDSLTVLTEAEATYYLRESYKVVVGCYPSIDSLAILWAQTALECARWKSIHLNNWGNIKKIANIKYTSFKCNEVINGKLQWFYSYHPQTFFAAWENHLDGATAYLKFLSSRPRYSKAWAQIKLGNPQQYCAELKAAGYFTADLTSYTKGVVSLTNEFKKKSTVLLAWAPTPSDGTRQSQLPTVIPTNDTPSEIKFHPDQENIKHIELPSWFDVLMKILKDLL